MLSGRELNLRKDGVDWDNGTVGPGSGRGAMQGVIILNWIREEMREGM